MGETMEQATPAIVDSGKAHFAYLLECMVTGDKKTIRKGDAFDKLQKRLMRRLLTPVYGTNKQIIDVGVVQDWEGVVDEFTAVMAEKLTAFANCIDNAVACRKAYTTQAGLYALGSRGGIEVLLTECGLGSGKTTKANREAQMAFDNES